MELIKKYHDIAKVNGAIVSLPKALGGILFKLRNLQIIPEIGVESAPSDLLAWSLVSLIRDKLSVGTKEVITSVHELQSATSGDTIDASSNRPIVPCRLAVHS